MKRSRVVIGVLAVLILLPFVRLVLEPPSELLPQVAIAIQPAIVVGLVAYLFGFSLKPAIWGVRARRAARRGNLRLVYQPKTALGGRGELLSVEALVRWDGPKPKPPDMWVPYVERGFWSKSFNLWVIDQALSQVADWRARGLDVQVCVNLSPQLLSDPSLPDEIVRRLCDRDLPPSAMPLEITERALAEGDHSIETVNRLAVLGIDLYLDDFGIGYSSLRRLVTLPLAGLKIDRSFVLELGENERAAAAVLSAVELGRSMHLTVCAEGIETAEVWHRLRLLGADVAQGYLIARPMPPDEMAAWIERTGGAFLPDRRDGEERRREYASREAVLEMLGYDRREGVERRHSARDLIRERRRSVQLLRTDDVAPGNVSPQAP